MDSFLSHDLMGEECDPFQFPRIGGGLLPTRKESSIPEDAINLEEELMGKSDISFDPFFACPPEAEDFPEEDASAVERRQAKQILQKLRSDNEYASIPVWIAVKHPDLVQEVFCYLFAAEGISA